MARRSTSPRAPGSTGTAEACALHRGIHTTLICLPLCCLTASVYHATWHHITFVEVSGDISIYVDGNLDSTHTRTPGREPRSVGWGTHFHQALFDDLCVYRK